MKARFFLKSLLDGGMQGIVLHIINDFLVSTYSQNMTEYFYVVGGLCAILPAIVYFLMVYKEKTNKKLIAISLCSAAAFVLTTLILLVLQTTVPLSIFPLRETNAADGLIILLASASYLLMAVILKLAVFVVLLIKNFRRAKVGKN